MSGWLLNIVGVVFLGVILDIILPEGKTNSFIKHVFVVFLLFVIVSPIKNLINSNFSLSANQDVVDNNFIYNTNLKKVAELEKLVAESLESNNIKNCSVIINANIFDEDLSINSVYVDASKKEISNDVNENNYKNKIVQVVTQVLNIESGDVVVYG